jgi:UDP-N-acetyl-2-amino-2-deoxyglucuronate dehydrogenase
LRTYTAAIIGCGRMGAFIDNETVGSSIVTLPFSFAEGFAACDRTRLVAGSDLRPDVLSEFGKRYGLDSAHTYSDYRELIDRERPYIVGVATMPEHRAEIMIYAAEHGVKAIYAEKTLAASMVEADAVVQAVESNGVAFNMGTGFRWHPGFDTMKGLIDSGELGALRDIVLLYRNGINQHGIHALDLAMYLNNDVPAVSVQASLVDPSDDPVGDVMIKDPDARGIVEFANGVTAHLMIAPSGDEQSIYCEKGYLGAFGARQQWVMRRLMSGGHRGRSELTPEPFPDFEPASSTLMIIEDLVQALDSGGPTRGGVQVARAGDELTFAFVESHLRGGARINLPLKGSRLRLDRNPEPRPVLFEPRIES